ncbi:MAG TPA: GAF domain-containing protein [Thermoflexia bacterium]|nr:GAF domain-containing protein [Thermoflexia bacterium]
MASRNGDGRTIAILCCDPADRRRLAEAVEGLGYSVVAPPPDGAVPSAWEGVDLVIADEAAARRWMEDLLALKSRAGGGPVPLLIALPRGEDGVLWVESGFDDVVWLPPSDAELAVRLRVLLRLRGEIEGENRQQETIFRALLERSPVGVYLFDKDRYLYVNLALAEIVGYRPEEIVGRMRPLDLIHPEDRPMVQGFIHQRLSGEQESAHYVLRALRKDGSAVYCEVFGRRVDYQGRPAIVGIVVDITDRRQAEEALERRAAYLALLSRVGQEIVAARDLEGLLQRATRLVQETFGYHHVALFLLDRERKELVMRARAGKFVDLFPPDHRVPLGQGLVGWAACHGERALANDVDKDSRYVNFYPDRIPTRSELCVPIRIGEDVVGVLDAQSPNLNAFCEDDVMVMETLADQVAVAIENIRLYQAEREERELAEALAKAAAVVGGTLDLDQVLDRILEQVGRVIPSDAANVMLIEEGVVRIIRWRGYDRFGAEEFVSNFAFSISEIPNLRQMQETKEPMVIPDTALYPGWMRVPVQEWLRSYAAAPIVVRGEVIGFLNVDSATPGFFSEKHLRPLQIFADYAASAIENARLYQAEQEQRELAEALAETASVVGGTLDLGQVLEGILHQVQRVVAGDAFNISLIEGGHARIVRAWGYEKVGKAQEVIDLILPIQEFYGLAMMTRTGAPVLVPDTRAEPGWVHVPGWEWIRSYVGAPIRVKGLTVGFLNVDGTRPWQFSRKDAQRLQVFADQVGTAIENARLYQQLQKYAEDLEMRVRERTAQLAAQYARLEAVLRSATDGIVVANREGEILQANPVAQAWLERTLSPDDAARLREGIRDLAGRAEERPEEMLELTGLDLEMRAAPITGSDEEGLAVVAIHDVTRLRALDRMRSRFISNISHELRTPLATIKLYAALMRRQPARWAEHLEPLEKEVDRLVELVEGILEFSRIDAGRVALATEKIPLHQITRAVVERYRVIADEKGITLAHHPMETGPVVEVDPERMQEVVDNLVSNAVRYTPSGGRVEVSTGLKRAEDRVWATITVADTGIGIPEEELPFIFDRFYRGETPRRMQISGTGLGLAIVKELVEMHGGWVTAESEVGKGSTFTVWLPLAEK